LLHQNYAPFRWHCYILDSRTAAEETYAADLREALCGFRPAHKVDQPAVASDVNSVPVTSGAERVLNTTPLALAFPPAHLRRLNRGVSRKPEHEDT
jgi:hypothetical protein